MIFSSDDRSAIELITGRRCKEAETTVGQVGAHGSDNDETLWHRYFRLSRGHGGTAALLACSASTRNGKRYRP